MPLIHSSAENATLATGTTQTVGFASTANDDSSDDSIDDSIADSIDDSNEPPPYSNKEEELVYRRTHGCCQFYPTDDQHPCEAQRSCYDCLNFRIKTEPAGCFVNPMGLCLPVSKYDPALAYTLGKPSNDYNISTRNASETSTYESQQFDFLSSNATYCANDDAQCLSCRETAFANVIYKHSDNSRSRYCVGKSGCVCVAICEAIEINHPNTDDSCTINAMSTQNANKSGRQVGTIAAVLGAMCFIVASVFVIYRIRKLGETTVSNQDGNRKNREDDDEVITPGDGASPLVTATPMRDESSSGLFLNLFGWTASREVLIQKEQNHADGINDAALEPVKNNNVQLIGAKPSAPDVETTSTTDPYVMIPYATLAVSSTQVAMTVRAMAAPSAPDYEMDSTDTAKI